MKAPTPASTTEVDASSRRVFVCVMLLVAALRLCIFSIGLLSLHHAPNGTEPRFNYEHPWLAWDGRHYWLVAVNGYSATRDGGPLVKESGFTQVAYFPFVPLVSRALSSVMPINVAMVLLSNVCSMVGFGFLYAWARRLAGARNAAICVLIAATFPGAVAFAAGMSEGPFLMLVALALWLLEKESFYWAALVAGIATATRPTGVALAMIVPLYAWFRQGEIPLPRRLATFAALSAIALSGIIGYEAFLWHRYKSPLAYFEAQTHWNYLEQNRLQTEAAHHIDRRSREFFLESLARPQVWNRAIAVFTLALCLVGLIKPMGIPRVTFLLPLAIFLMTSLPGHGLRISSVPRYESAAAPLFLLIAIWLFPRRRAILLVGLLLIQFLIQVYYAALFPREIWVG